MRSASLLFLAIALWAEGVHALECMDCNSTEYTGCKSTEHCSSTHNYCVRYIAITSSGFRIIQSCATTCPIAPKMKWPPMYTYMCCQSDQCNAARGMGSCRTLLAAAVLAGCIRGVAILGF